MTRGQLIVLHVANLAVAGTGLVYAWMRYLVEPADEWAVVNHPWQPFLQHLHVLAAPLLVFAVGLIWSGHVAAKLRNGRRNRVPGVGLTALFLPMAASGYLLQVAVDPGWRARWIWIHVAASLLWIGAFIAHQIRALGAQSGTEASASVMRASQTSAPPSGSPAGAGSGAHRSADTGTGTSSESRADATSAAEGALPK